MNKSVVIFFAFSAALFAQGPRGGFGPMGGRGMGMFGVGPQALVTGAPYSAVEVVQTVEPLADGNRITTQRQTGVFRDSQGRIRTEETITPPASSGKQPYTVATILDFVGGYRYVLDSSTMTAFQSPLRAPSGAPMVRGNTPRGNTPRGNDLPQENMARRNSPQIVSTNLSPQSVNGVLAAGTQHTETIPAGAIGNAQAILVSRTVWMSNELKVPVQIKSSDPRFGTTSMELTNIVQAEPSATLFLVPAGYTMKTGDRGPGRPGGPMRGFGAR
jgi:hypothetical protein